jgi:hypothetical protein
VNHRRAGRLSRHRGGRKAPAAQPRFLGGHHPGQQFLEADDDDRENDADGAGVAHFLFDERFADHEQRRHRDHAVKLAQAGYALDADELSERTGYKLEVQGPQPSPSVSIPNRWWDKVKALFNGDQVVRNEARTNWEDGTWRMINGNPVLVADTPEQKAEITKGKAAIERAMATQSDVLNAMTHPELGAIDFWWERGSQDKGLAKILAKHHEMSVRLIPFVVARGQLAKRQGNEVVLTYNGWRAVLTKTEGRDANHWVLTNYYDEKGRGR